MRVVERGCRFESQSQAEGKAAERQKKTGHAFTHEPSGNNQNAAKAANIPPDKIDETVRALSDHMGWDITKGSEAVNYPHNQKNLLRNTTPACHNN